MKQLTCLTLSLLALTTPALADQNDECGRWAPCASPSDTATTDYRSYVYGQSGDIEPWKPHTSTARTLVSQKSSEPVETVAAAPRSIDLGGAPSLVPELMGVVNPMLDPDLAVTGGDVEETLFPAEMTNEEIKAADAYLDTMRARNRENGGLAIGKDSFE